VNLCRGKSAGIPTLATNSHSQESHADTAEFSGFCMMFRGLAEGANRSRNHWTFCCSDRFIKDAVPATKHGDVSCLLVFNGSAANGLPITPPCRS